MTPGGEVLALLRRAAERLSPAEARVARAVLADPALAMRSSIGALAQAAGVSEPTVARCCRSLGFEGFTAFKLALAQQLGRGVPWVSATIAADDPPATYASKILSASIAALERVAGSLDAAAIGAAVAALVGARQILLFGLGGSGPVAHDAQHKLVRLEVPTIVHVDPILQRMAAATAGPADVLLAISVSGRTRSLVENVSLARATGATVIALTAPGSPLAAMAAPLLAVEPAEDMERYTPMGSRLAHLALIDVLATGIVLAKGGSAVDRLARLKASLAETRLPV